MHVIEVIPLVRGAHMGTLSYYAATTYPIGTLLDIPVRQKIVRGLVIGVKPVSMAKTAVRTATFSLRRLPEQQQLSTLPGTLIQTAERLQSEYPASLGALLYTLLPSEIRKGELPMPSDIPVTERSHSIPEVHVLQATHDERYITYRSLIRESFAHRGSVLFIVPTSVDVEHAAEQLAHGIEKRVVLFSPAHSEKKRVQSYQKFTDYSTAKLVIATPSHAYLRRHDMTTVIMEHARSRHYKSRVRPYLDHRTAQRIAAAETGCRLFFGDILPRTEEEHLRREEIYSTIGEHPKRLDLSGTLRVLEVKKEPAKSGEPFTLFSSKLIEALFGCIKDRGHAFLYAARRGIAPLVTCTDCGYIFRCPDSGSPYSLFRTHEHGEEKRWFLSHTSGKRIRAADTCHMCGSWRIKEQGIGIQYIEDELKKHLPDTQIIVFDSTTIKTRRAALGAIASFYDTKGAILLGTSMVLPYIDQQVDLSAIVSYDAARSIPSWRAEEEFLGLALELRDKTTGTVYVQTRTEPDEILEIAKQGLVDTFYTEEITLRRTLQYPPCAHFILLTWEDTKEQVESYEQELATRLATYTPRFYSEPTSLNQKTTRHGLIRIPRTAWPDPVLFDLLANLPPFVKIEIDPDRIV